MKKKLWWCGEYSVLFLHASISGTDYLRLELSFQDVYRTDSHIVEIVPPFRARARCLLWYQKTMSILGAKVHSGYHPYKRFGFLVTGFLL